MIRTLLLSNMFPSARWPAFGTFVEAHARCMQTTHPSEVAVTPVVITDPRKGWRTPVKYAGLAARAWGRSALQRFDVVHVHYAYPTIIGARAALARGAKLVITAHGGDVNEMLVTRAPEATRRAFLHADHIIAVSEDIAAKLRDRLGNACPEISVCNMGVDAQRFDPRIGAWGNVSAPRIAPQSPVRLFFIGQLIDRKGVDVLLRAAARLSIDWQLDIIGTGPKREALGALAQELGIASRVAFHGAVPHQRLPVMLWNADVFVGPSREEPLGLVFLEAAAACVPVVATRVGGIPELFRDRRSALLVEPDNPEALSEAITRAATEQDWRSKMIFAGLTVAEENSLHRSVNHTLNVYREVLARTKATRVAMIAYTHCETDPRVRREAEAAANAGHGVDVIALRRSSQPAHERVGEIDVFRMNMDRYRGGSGARYMLSYARFLLRSGWWLFRNTRRRRLKLIHVNTMPDFMVLCALWPRVVHRLPVILDIHDTMPEIFAEKFGVGSNHWKIRFLRWQEVMSTRFATAVVTSEHTKAALLARHGVRAEKITVLLNLPDPKIFGSPDDPPTPESADCFRLVYHGTLAHRLGVDIALRALAIAREEMDALGPWRFDILGEGDARPSLLALRDELKLTDRVHFSDGFVPTETLPRQLRGAALGLVPSRLRPDTAVMLPTKLVEYAHLGIPVVATATETVLHCFNREQIQLVSDENPSLWAEAILDLRRDSGKRRRRAEAARAFSRENRWDHHLEVYLQLIQQLTG